MSKLKLYTLFKKETNLTFEEGCEEYLLYCKARNLRDGTIKHYKESMKSIYRFIVPNIIPLSHLLIKRLWIILF